MAKVTQLSYISPRCQKCGRSLPKGRTAFCRSCRPPKSSRAPKPEASGEISYTLEQRVAQAWACRMSYGQYMAAISNGVVPEPLYPVVWPDEKT